jgi:cytochrome b pre-mRNA-processing protein 6
MQTVSKHYSRILSQWPKDPLRPEVSFQKVLEARVAASQDLPEGDVAAELRNTNALYSLLDNRYTKKVSTQ